MRLRRYCRWSNLLLGLIAAVGIARVSVTRTEAACVAPPSGLAAWWSGNGNTLDFAGAHPGTMANQAYFAPGQAGLGFALTGANAYVYVPPSPAWNLGTNAFSIELWANFNATGDRVLVASDAGGGSNNKWLFWTTGGKLQFHINDTTGNVSNIGTGSFTPTLGQWYHLGLTRSGSNFVFYVNGAPLVTNSVDRVIPDTGAPLTIGQAEGGYFFNGILDEVSIYNKALTGAEVQSVFQAGGAGKCGATTSGGAVPYATDFEAPIGQEWSSTVASTESTAVFSRFTGRFSNEAQTLVLTNLVPGQAYTVGFDFYALDTWDGTSGGDAFNVVVNGNSVFHETFSNYNGNPPSSPQSYPGDPDEGRADFGFTQGYVDAIYRNIEVPFVASNSVVAVAFYGQNLQNLDDESWGLDNVSVRLSSSLPGTVIRTTTLPAAGSTVSTPIDIFSVSASHPLQAASAGATGSWSLRSAGPDGTLGNADDVTIPLTISLPGPGGRSVSFAVANVPLQPAKYRFQSLAGLQGTNNVAVPTFTRDFTIANLPAGAVENSDNDSLATATPLPLVESPVGSGFYTAFGVGTFASTSDVDYWRIDAEAGDRLSLQLEADARGVYPQVYIQNPAGQNLAGYGGDNNGRVGFQNFTFGTPGTYYLRVYSNNRSAHYGMRLDLSRGPYLENEGNDSQASANIVPFTVSAGLYQAKVAGGLSSSDPAGDYFQLGTLNAGNVISLSTHFPTGSALAAGRIVLTVELAGNPVALVTNTSGTLNFNSPSNGIYYVHIQAPVADLRNQYEMDIAISDSVAPQVTAVSLPAEGTTTTALIDRFTASFSEDLGVLSATNQANYELRGAGVDGNFGTADDTLYDVSSSGYTTGLVVSYSVSDGPLQAGKYRFTLRTGTADRAGNSLATPYVRNFNVGPVPGFVTENRSDDVGGLATSLSASPSVVGNGTFGYLTGYGTGANPYFLVAGRLDTDTAPDLAVANGSSGSVSILLNDGTGNFNNTTNIATGALPVALAMADFNRDGTNDLAVANYNAGTVSVLFGLNKGNFQSSSNYPGFSNPNGLVAGDLNGDGRPDLAVANFGNNTIQILLDNANGTFSPSTNFAAGSGPVWVAVGDLNHDGKADLAVANYYASTISIFMGVGNGSFTLKTNLPCGSNPRFTVITDVSGDGNTDLVVNESGANQVGVWLGNGDGTFANPQHYLSALSDSRQLVVVDVNGDSKPDLVVPGYANNRFSVFLNTGAGLFADADAYGAGSNPIAVAAADFNADGRVDLAFANYNGGGISIWSGNGASPLTEDPAGSGLFTGVGRGIRSSSDDVDFYQFSGKAGDSAVLAVETPGNPPTSSLYYQVLNLDGGVLLSFGADNFGYAESGVFTLPRTGTYLVRVAANQDYQGEYRIRVTLARPPLQLVNEANGGIDQARSLTLSRTNSNHLKASVAGYIGVSDQNGDYYTLGDLPAGTTLALTLTEPSTSGLAAVLAVIDAAGNVVTNSAAGAASFSFTVPAGKGGSYYARVTAAPGGFTGTSETALYFNGAAGTDLGPWFNNQTFTLSMWVNPAASQNTYADILDNNHNSTVGWVIQQDVGNNNHYIFGSADGSSGVPFVLAANTWQNLTVTRDSTNINRVYINGVLAGSAAGTGQINYDGNQFLRIGRWGGGGRNWNGTFDELRIWNRMLTPAEITAGLTGSLVGNEAGLLGYWRFNEGAGTVSTDLTSAHHDAQLGSGTSWSFLAPNSAIPQGLLSQYILGIDLSGSTAPAVLADTLPGQGVNSSNIITEFNVSFSTEVDKEFARLSRDVRKFGGHSYFVTDSSSDWATAEGRAVAAGGHLVDITSAAENSWIYQNFNPYGDLWIGLRYASGGAGFAWSSGAPFSYSNWNGGEPNNAGTFESAAEMVGGGGWVDIDASPARYGVIEISSSTDTDGDGLVNAIDPYPNDPLNAFDLRAAGPDGNFDTGDDVVYRIVAGSYAGGLTARFSVVDGPLQPGNYRFKVTTALRDRLGNTIAAPYVHTFTVSSLPGFVQENRGGPLFPGNTSIAGSTSNRLDGSFTGLATFGVGRNPYFVTSGRFNQDTNLDVVSANYSDGNISILLGDGTGQLIAATNISTGGGAISVAKGDFNGDGKLDLAVANYTGNTISILLGAGDGSFAVSSTLTGFSNPVNLAAVDVDKDNKLDLIVPNAGNSTVVIWKGDGAGGFTSGASVPIPNQPWTVVSGDFDKDTKVDFAVASVSSQSTFVVLGNGDGTFKTPQSIPMAVDIRAITAGDLDGDGNLDLVTGGPGARLSVLMGVGDGTFLAPVTYDVGLSDTYQVVLADVDGNGTLDVVVPSYGNSRLVTVLNDGTGHLGGTTSYAVGGNPISLSMGDFNNDSRLDIVTANYSGQSVSIYLGNDRELLNLDGAGTGLRIAAGRGSLSDINDADYWTFSASAGDRVAIAAEVPGDPSNTSLHYVVYRPDGSTFFDFYGDNQGRAQGQGIAPSSGTYSLRVEYNNQYFGEYRFRVTLASPPVQLESEDNSSLGNADALTYDINAGVQSASVLGYLSRADGAGDYFALGNLAVATKIDLKSARPATSALYPVLEIYSSDGTLVTNGVPGGTNLSFVIPDGEEGAYFAHVTGSYGARSATATNALYFNGANNYVNTGAWTPGTQWSVQAWVQAASLPGGRRVVAGGFGACRDWGLVLQDGRWGTAFRQPGGCSTTLTSPIVPIPGVWYHVASISDGTNAFLYVNGVLQGTAPVEPNYSAYEGGTFIGADICCGEYFPGVIQDVSIWGKPLSQAQVSAFMAQSPLGSEQGLGGYWRLNEGSGNTSTDLSPNGHNGTFVNGPTWIRTAPVGALPSGIMQQYLLSISLTDTVPPQVVSVSSPIPDEGSSTSALVDRFSLTFSGDMSTPTVTNAATYELRGAGPDNTFGNADDVIYTVVNTPAYTTGTQASYQVLNAPLQVGKYRLTVKTTLANRSGTPLASAYVRNFTVANLPGFVLEGRFDDAFNQAVSFSTTPSSQANGTVTRSNGFATGNNPYFLATGQLNGGNNLDLVVANYGNGTVSVLLNQTNGSFARLTNYVTGAGAIAPILGKFDADANQDLAVLNYQAGTVSILKGQGDGTFQPVTNYNVGSSPVFGVATDLNSDGKVDLAIAQYSGAKVSVLLGNGDGTFQAPVSYNSGANPGFIAVADFNNDGKPDLIVPNYGADSLTLFVGNGNGTFAAGINIPAGNNPQTVAVADFNGDNKLDLAVGYGAESRISVYLGNGNASFQPRFNLDSPSSSSYQVIGADINGDGLVDIIATGYYSSSVVIYRNKGGAVFEPAATYGTGSNPVGLVAGDWNGDGRLDLASADYNAGGISVFLGNDTELLGLDAGTGMRIGAGRGVLSTSGDADYWQFDASAGDGIAIAAENPGSPAASGLHFIIYRPGGATFTDFYQDYYGRGQGGGVAPVSGTYTVRVEPNYNYTGEYRLRVSLLPAGVQLEAEDNGTTGNANVLNLATTAGHRQGKVFGYVGLGDGGDHFRLGTASVGAAINLSLAQPASSGLLGSMGIVDSGGNLVAYSPGAAATLSYTIPAGGDGVYYARVVDMGPYPARSFGGTGGFAVRLDGGSDYLSVASGPVPASGDFTFECWAFAAYSSSYREIVSQGTGGNAFYLGTDGTNIRVGDSWSNTTIPFPFTGWHHFAVVKSASDTLLLIDGVQVAALGHAIANPSATELRFGRQYGPYSEYWPGGIDEVRIWNTARTTNVLSQNMTNRLTGSEAGLVGYWRFDEGAGTVVHDATTNGHDAQFQGHPFWLPQGKPNVQPAGIFSQYVLAVDVNDTTPPAVTAVTLPAAGTTATGIYTGFTLNFSKDLDPTINALNRFIRVNTGHAYTLTDSTLGWADAETQAKAVGGHLVTVNDASENAWINTTFTGLGNLWIGFTDEAQKGTWVWSSGQAAIYTNWANGSPDNSGNRDYAYLQTDGKWNTSTGNGNFRGVIEVSGADTDGDGIADTLDPYPNDPLNVFDLRATGPDGQFDTGDDQVYRLATGGYTSGGSLDFSVTDGPLQPGNYRFTVTSSLKDRFGNGLGTPFTQFFTIGTTLGYTGESRANDSQAAATPITLAEDIPGMRTGGGRGALSTGPDVDYWSFAGKAGDLFLLSAITVGNPGASGLHYIVYRPDGSQVTDFYGAYNGDGQSTPVTLPVDGVYAVGVFHNYGYTGEYRIRVTMATPPLAMEAEENGTLATGTSVGLAVNGNALSGGILGAARTASDLDYFKLGTVTNGSSIVLTVRRPGSSGLVPVVSVYNAAGTYQAEVVGNPADDGAANVPVTVTGTYFALVRPSNGTGGIDDQYVLDVQIVPTGSLNFPNLVVSGVVPPAGSGILSGQTVKYSYTVLNSGNTPTPAPNWIDRVVLSTDPILGNADDVSLGFFPHSGVLAPGASYNATNSLVIPDGLSGDFYVVVQADAGNAINELLFEGDNTTSSGATFHVDVAPYPDVSVENLVVSAPDANHQYTVTWKTANHGTAAAPSGFVERLVVVNQTTGVTLKNVNLPLAVGVPINGAVAHSQTVTATDAGNYLVTVVTDSGDALFEYNGAGHVSAESNNTATAQFGITVNFNVTVASSPVGAGTLTGAGSYASGTPVTVVATPNTNDLPYLFVNWTEGGAFQSGTSNYAFVIGRDRTLTANFTLPSFVVSVANNPVAAGSVTGQGTYFYGFTNILSATANFGYRFTNWTENGSVVGTTPLLTNIVKKNRTLVANYVEANTVHTVVTGTFPTNVTTVAGAGNFNNGQTADVVAPLSVTNAPNVYTFREFRVNGTLAGTSTTVHKLFSTVDPTNLVFVAYYDSISIKPLVTNLLSNIPGTIPATTNFILGIQFNRGMNTNVAPGISLTNPAAGATQASVPAGGTWSTTVNPNDTFTLKPITFSAGMDGTNRVRVSLAKDLNGSILDPTNVVELLVDVTAPLNPTVSLISSNSVSATVSWVTYLAPADINGFRLYIAPTNFSSVSSLVAVSSVASATRTFTYTGLNLDTDYYVAATAVDAAGNSASTVVPLKVRLPSTVPPPVAVNVAAASSSSATVSWTGYNTGSLFGFGGFRLYYETTDFNTVTGHSIRQSLAPDVRTFTVEGLDRTKTYHFAVVGYNGTNGFNATVATGSWSDPYAGVIASDTTLGGGGETTVDVLHDISIQNNAVLTIPAGTTVRFAAGTGITVQQGVIHADGTALDPVVFTSIRDQAGQSPAPGDWKGIGFTGASGATLLRHVFVKYGGGLLVTNASFTLDAFSALYNKTVGLGLFNGAALNTTNALLAYNGIGAEQSGASHLTLRNSVIKNNDTNAFSIGGSSIVGQANWWGSAVAGDIAALNVGAVDTSNFLTTEPILTPAIGIVGNVTQVSTSTVDLRLASRTADAMRVSEDSTFAGVFFTPFSNSLAFALSDGGGHKSIYAQFRSVTGATNPPVTVAVEYVTQGPTITAYSLEEGDSLTRPLRVTGTSTAPLGIIGMSLNVDGTQVATNAAGSFSTWLDIRGYTAGIHRVELVARDNGGAIARSGVNVTISPNPPSAPVIVVPIDHKVVNTPTIVVSGTAEPFLGVRIVRASVVLATGTADAAGNWSFPAVPLADGNNALAAVAFDTLGSASSPVITVSLNTGPPVAVVQDLPFYNPTDGLSLSWHYPTNGTAANRFRVFWNQAPFSSTNGVVGSSPVLTGLTYKLPTIPAGFYYFAVVGYDEAGNASALSNLQPFAYDPFPPAFAIGFDKASPVGVGPVHITLTASKALSAPPSLTLKWPSTAPVALSVVNTSLNTYEATLNVTPFTASGLIDFTVSAQDLLGNVFQGAPTGVPMVVDVVLPTGRIATSPLSPIQTTNSTNVSVSLTLSKPAKAGTAPQLTFAPPTGSVVPLTVTGAGTNWSTTLPLTPAMGSGFGAFALTVSDQLDNVGQVITTGGFLEIYNTAKPSAPAAPTIFEVASVPGGGIKLAWTPITNAEIYRVYSKPGTNGTPVDLVTDGLTDTVYTNFPPADGYYRIAVTASRRGAEGTNSNIIIGLADSTPPPAPTNLVTELAASGVDIKWQRGEGKAAFTYRLYRNDVLIQTIAGSAETNYFTTDSPPRGTMVYRVGALDQIGNEALSDTSTIQLLVGAVNQFTVLATAGQAPYLTWTSTDPTAVGFNIYRDGIKQNSTPIPAAAYLDSLGIPKGGQVSYVVKAVNSTNAESAARRVTASSLAFSLGVNVVNGTNQALIQRYFDDYRVTVSNLTSATSVGLDHLELVRTVATGDTLTRTDADGVSIGAGNYLSRDVVFPGSLLNGAQSVMVRAIQAPDIGGSKVIYQRPFDFGTINPPTSMIDISAAQPPLAGGLASLNLRIYNRGYAAMDLLVARDGGSSPSDLGISLINQFGQEVGHAGYKAIPPGAIFAADGRVFLRVSPGQSTQIQVTNILVPESLGTNGLFFQATFPQIYYDLGGTKEVAGGPLQGGMISSLAVTPYFGTATTDHQFYANDDPVIITGAAVDRVTQNPVPNVPLKIGFSISGTKFYQDITTDGTGHYSFAYNPPQGLSGTIKLWAAHPAVFDILNQAQVTIYRVYMSPGQVDLRMSKNDHLDFSVGLINPGDATLSGFQLETDVFRMEGTNLIPITTLTATADVAPDFIAGPKAVRQVKFRLQAALDAPDNAVVHFRLRSAEGAIAELSANVMLLPAQPLLAVIDPTVGYAEVSVNRGNLVSKTVTIANKGLRDLQGVTLSQPTNINWITVNLPTGPDGKIHLPDMAVGATNQFTVVFAPPASIDLDFYQDQFVIAGTNADATFPVGVYALVTSSVKGDVKFYVDDILVQAVPNATIRIKNTLINEERIAQTDLNGFVTITNLQEGHWAWQVGAPGYSTTVGVADVVGGQTIMQETRLSKSLVTVNFTVVPVPFTDRYEITIEQTFETHVPAPVLVLTPPNMDFRSVGPGYDATFLVTAKNYGLIQMTDLKIEGMTDVKGGTLTPLITYVPLMRAQESIVIPFHFTYQSNGDTGGDGGVGVHSIKTGRKFDGGGFADCATGGLGGLADFVSGLMAFANAHAQCVDARAAMAILASLAVTYSLLCAPSFSPLGLLPSPCPSGGPVGWIISFFINALSCFCQNSSGGCFGGGDDGGGNGPGGPDKPVFTKYGGGGPECFEAGTQVLLADGSVKLIEQVQAGDRVRTGSREEDIATVGSVESHVVNGVYQLQFGGGRLNVTGEHLIWLDGHGWTAARNVQAGDWLMGATGQRVQVTGTVREPRQTTVYTFTNMGDHAFIANGMLVHDQCGQPAQLTAAKPGQNQ